MRRGEAWRLLGILLIVVVSGGLLWFMPINLGLDLRGGVHAVLEGQDTSETKVTREVMQRVQAVIERRIDALGVSEPVLQLQGNRRLIVELPGVKDPKDALETIGRTARLEIQDPLGKTALTGADLGDAQLTQDEFGRPGVSVTFTKDGARKFAQLTRTYQGMQIPHVLDDEVLVNPVVQEPILNGQGVITGRFTIEEAKNLAVLLKSGALPVPIEVLEVRNVGPTLGREAIDQSVRAGLLGLALTLLFILAVYRRPGALAALALGVYILLVLGILVAMRATLTLPGIAGFILSVGMAVDANVIIFERVKDELRHGKRLRAATEAGWDRAFQAILDSNVTTLLSALILFYFGTGPIRGFAVTLTVGIVASMFTAIVVTRVLLRAVVDRNPGLTSRYFGVREALK